MAPSRSRKPTPIKASPAPGRVEVSEQTLAQFAAERTVILESLRAMIAAQNASMQALMALLERHPVGEKVVKAIAARQKKEEAVKAEPVKVPEPVVEPPEPPVPAEVVAAAEATMKQAAKAMADIKPVKASKTAADLRVALQECITKHGMGVAKERLAPFGKLSDVPDEKLVETIERLAA